MRSLAEYVMHGRRQAIIVVLLCGFFPMLYFISAAVVALVNLRRGWSEGSLLLLWSLLPAGLLWSLGDTTPVVLMLGVTALALLLRRTGSWQLTILAATLLGVVIQLSLYWQPGYVAQIEAVVNEMIEAQLRQGGEARYTQEQLVNLLLRFYGAYHVIAMVLCLMLGRWWQALLYNPGGFQQEFHQLRFDPRAMLVLLAMILIGMLGVPPLDTWLAVLSVPAMFGGLAVMHNVIASKKLGTHWLILGYLTLLLMSPAIIALGLMDSVFNFRKRVTT